MPNYIVLKTGVEPEIETSIPAERVLSLETGDGELSRMQISSYDALPEVPSGEPNVAVYRSVLDLAGGAPADDANPTAYLLVGLDVEAEHEADFNAWYDEEHLPALSRVDGVIRAHRYERIGTATAPDSQFSKYLAIYDLVSGDIFSSPAWKAAVETPWTNRLRPHFQARIRNVYRPVQITVND